MPATLRFTEDFAGSGDLNGSPVGATAAVWQAVAGAWSRTNGKAATASAPSTNPILATDLGVADADITLDASTTSGGDALYFRVTDAQNWWRLRQRYTTSSYTVITGYKGTGWVVQSTYHYAAGPAGTYYSGYQNGVPTVRQTFTANPPGNPYGPGTYSGTYSTQSVVPVYGTATTTTRYLILDYSVAGTVTTAVSWAVSSLGKLRVTTVGDQITCYEPDGLTVHSTVTSSVAASATLHGLGKGGSDSSAYSTSLDNWVGQISGSAAAPSILAPADNADVELAATISVQVQTNYPPGDPPTAVDVRWRKQGDTAWTETDAALAGDGVWPLPADGLHAGDTVEVQARSTDSFSTVSDWSGSIFFTVRVQPDPPVIVQPASGGIVTAVQVAIINFDTPDPSTGRQVRRVADAAGQPDTTAVYEDDLALTGPDFSGYYTASGDGVTHTDGPEHVQARRQTAAGGGIWSAWADVLVTMQQAQPQRPDVARIPLPADAAIRFEASFGPADALHTATVRWDVFRDGVRVHSVDVTGQTAASWKDQFAGPASDYRFVSVDSDGGIAEVK